MASNKNQFQQLSQRIVINLAKQMELKQQASEFENKSKELDVRVAQLTREVKLLTEENTDLKEIVYELHYENQRLRKMTGAEPPDEIAAG